MFSVPIGDITMTHFRYGGVEVDLQNFDPDAGNVLVLTTLQGWTRHAAGTRHETELTVGETFVADCSRVDYRLAAAADHLQLNLTIPHRLLSDLALQWWGRVPPDERLWSHRCAIGGPKSPPWLALLTYATRTASVAPAAVATGRIGRNLQEMILAQLLDEWSHSAGVDLTDSPPTIAAPPGYVRTAVQYIETTPKTYPPLPIRRRQRASALVH